MQMLTMSLEEAKQAIPSDRCYLISISEPNDELPIFQDGWKGILRLHFDDIDKPGDPIPIYKDGNIISERELIPFSMEQAVSILNFIEDNKDDIQILAIHCLAGISRSVGIRVALEKIYNNRDVYTTFPCHNRHVARTIYTTKEVIDGR